MYPMGALSDAVALPFNRFHQLNRGMPDYQSRASVFESPLLLF